MEHFSAIFFGGSLIDFDVYIPKLVTTCIEAQAAARGAFRLSFILDSLSETGFELYLPNPESYA